MSCTAGCGRATTRGGGVPRRGGAAEVDGVRHEDIVSEPCVARRRRPPSSQGGDGGPRLIRLGWRRGCARRPNHDHGSPRPPRRRDAGVQRRHQLVPRMSGVSQRHAHHRVPATSRLFRLRIRLSSTMWLPVLAANVVAVALALGLPVLDEHLREQGALPITTSATLAIFGALAGGMITFTGIVFSAVFVAAQIQTSSYSPRLAARIRRDPVVIAGLALPTATASYALFALAAIGPQTQQSGTFAPAVTVVFGLALAAVTLGAFVALVQRMFESTQIGGILRALMRRAHSVIDDVHPR